MNRRRRDYGIDSNFGWYLAAGIALAMVAGFGLGMVLTMYILEPIK